MGYTLQSGNSYAYVGHWNSNDTEQRYFLKTYYANNQIGSVFTKLWSGGTYEGINEIVSPTLWDETETTSDFDTTKRLQDEYGNIYTFVGKRPKHPPRA